MSAVRRFAFVVGLWFADAIVMTWWLFFLPEIQPLMDQFSGPFTPGWGVLKWVIPTFCVAIALLGGVYLVIGGVQREQARQQRAYR